MSAAEALGLPPGVRFDPTSDELVEFYLLPRALGRPPAVPGIIIEDAAATTSAQHPWRLLERHCRTDDSEAYFFERAAVGVAGARQDRSCDGHWTWVGQKREKDEALPPRGDGGDVACSWGKYSLNLQKGPRRGGSTGWVMHEYTVASPSPQCPLLPVKLCHVSFTGHGQKRQRVPDDDELGHRATPAAQHKRAATGSPSPVATTRTTAMPNQEQRLPIYNPSSAGHFWSSDAGFSQESSIKILDPSYPDARSNPQEQPFPLDHVQQVTRNQEPSASQSQAYQQEQFMNPGSIQEPLAGHPLVEEEQLSWAQLLSAISSPRCPPTTTPAACHEQQQIQNQFAQAAMAHLPLSTEQESCTTEQSHGDTEQIEDFFSGWGGDLNSFCDTSGVQDDEDMAAQTFAADGYGGGMSWGRHLFAL